MAVKKVGSFNIHETPAINQNEFDVETYLNANWEKTKEAVNNNAEELMQAQKDISTLKEDNKTNKSSIDVLEKSNETRDRKISKNAEDIEAIQGSIKTATETINKKDNEQDGKITLNKESIKEIQAENERLREDIKSIALQGEASGENIHLEDSSEARCEIEIGGNQKQETREGYNQININDFFEGTRNGVTITKDLEKGSLTFNGTVTSTFAISIPLNLSKGTIISYSLNNSKINKEVIMRLGIANGQIGGLLCNVVNAKKENFELTEDINEVQIRIGAGITLESFVVFPQLETNTSLHNFEIYGASPSLDYPSPVKSVGNNVNLFPGWEMGTIDVATGNKITDPYYIRSVDFIPILPNIDYTIYSINSFGFDSLNTALRLYDKDKKYLGSQYLGEILEKNLTFKITNLDARFMIPTSTNGQTNVIPKNAKVDIKLEKGIIATPYSSYNYGSAKVDIVNENIFNTENVKSTSEVSVVDNKNGVLELQGVNGFWKGITTTQKFETGKRVYIKCKVVEGTGSSGNIGIKDTNGDDILENYKVSNNLISCSFISKGITKIFFRCNGTSNNGNIKYYDIMFSYEDIDYVPNQEQSYLVDVQQEMLEGDTFVRQDGKWYEMHNWIKIIVDGTNVKVTNTKDTGYVIQALLGTKNYKPGIGYSNRFIYDKVLTWKTPNTLIFTTIGVYLHFDRSLLGDLTINNENINAMLKKQYDSGNEIYVLGQLLEPQLLECTETQSKELDEIYNKAHTYKNITNISAESSEVNPIASVKYLKDPETEHNKLQVQIDEIKQLLSSTETSALLVNNLEKDLRMEVE